MKELEMNPYVIQIDKFVHSLDKLSKAFLEMEEKKPFFSEEQVEGMCGRVCDAICRDCGNHEICLGKERGQTYRLIWNVFQEVEKRGTELNVEVKRDIQKNCARAPKFLRTALDVYKEGKQELLWTQKMAQNREDCVVQLDSFAQMVRHAARELDASIFSDEHLERKIRSRFAGIGLKVLTMVFLVTKEGRYEIHVTVKAAKGQCVATKELAQLLSECCQRTMLPGKEERAAVGAEYCTVTCVEGPIFHTIQGVARIGKGCRKISGDSFSMIDLPGGRQGAILSDGMGAGETAYRESMMVVELLEELLDAGFPAETAIRMLNIALVMGREEVRFSTVDMSVFDLYSGKCEFLKAGASMTFIKKADRVVCVKSSSLPIGVVSDLEMDREECELEDGDVVVMVTDGVMDALPVGEQELLMKMIIEGTQKNNPRAISQHILEQVLECSGEAVLDDMTVLAVGIWRLEK